MFTRKCRVQGVERGERGVALLRPLSTDRTYEKSLFSAKLYLDLSQYNGYISLSHYSLTLRVCIPLSHLPAVGPHWAHNIRSWLLTRI